MAASGPSTNRSGRPRKASTAAQHGAPTGTPTLETSTPSVAGAGMSSMPPPSFSVAGPMTVADFELLATQLADSNTGIKRRLEIAVELRDSAETTRDFASYDKYLGVLLPVVCTVLSDERTIMFTKDNMEQRFRHTLLSFLHRLPHHEPLKQHASKIMELMIKLLKVENEENALSCIKIMIDGIRNHKEQAEPLVEPFLELVKQMYANTKIVVEKEFGAPPGKAQATSTTSPAPQTPAGEQTPQSATQSSLAKALFSPKVLTECPIAVVLIFQTYKPIMQGALLDFYPLVLESVKLQPEPQRLAHAEAKEKGDTFVGVAPGIGNREIYTELVKAQVKTMAFVAYILRGPQGTNAKDYLEVFPEACMRLLRDCPPEDVGTRKELLVATRHILSAESRSAFVPYIDTLLEERVLVGTGVSSRETLRPLAYSVVADLIHHVRNELPMNQLARVVYVFSCNLMDSSFSCAIQTMCAKLLHTLVDSIVSKGEPQEAARILRGMFITAMEKTASLIQIYDRLKAIQTREKANDKSDTQDDHAGRESDGDITMGEIEQPTDRQEFGWRVIEQAMPVYSVAYAKDSLESFCKEARYLFKTLLHTIRALLAASRAGGQDSQIAQPDGEMLGQFFQNTLRCLAIYEGGRDPREAKDAVELVDQILLLFEPHVFAEVWTNNMDFFVANAMSSLNVFQVLQSLITHDAVSHQLVAILLKYLMAHLEEMGSEPKIKTNLCLRLFKISFLAINTFIASNEAVLVPHLQKLIMDSFSYAAKAEDPAIYYHILRALFRSIGGGRFEALYKEVLPILQEMLDTLSYLLQHSSDPAQRDLFVELTLTVPVRLTNLLPHLSYLMKPLVHALQAGPELISQGLRTLELCIDNLTADFLDPTMAPVLRDLMAALQQLLKPIPAHRPHASAAVKILGKLGGRNRRFQEVDLELDYRPSNSELFAPIAFKGKGGKLRLSPVVDAAVIALSSSNSVYQEDAYQALALSCLTVFGEGVHNPESNLTFQQIVRGLLLATQQEALKTKASEFVRNLAKRIFAAEFARAEAPQVSARFATDAGRRRLAPLTGAFMDACAFTLGNARAADQQGLIDLLFQIASSLRSVSAESKSSTPADDVRIVHSLFASLIALCHEEEWSHKIAGVQMLIALIAMPDVSKTVLIDLEIDIMRAFLFCLRDAPKYAPRSSAKVKEGMALLLNACQSQDEGRIRIPKLVDTFVSELNSQSELCREGTHECIALLAKLAKQQPMALIQGPVKARLLDPQGVLFSKPLRAIQMPMQVGNIEAMTYLMELRPGIVEANDEFVRMLHEVLALADVEDPALKNPPNYRHETWVKTLRISCLKLLRATMALPELLAQPNIANIRIRIIQVYFKHVYSTNSPTSDIAHEGLRDVLQQQNKLPKDVLQTGLRPILVNLAEAKRLSVTGLDGLGRFLELLTNYFKVEIGVKLLDHLDTLGDKHMLAEAARDPLEDNVDIARMTRLVNIFRLLPPTAVQYLKSLTNTVVEVEAQLHQSAPGPFTVSLGRYLDRYHTEGAQNLLENVNIKNPRFIWTYRNIIASGAAPQLVEQVSKKAEAICAKCFKNPEDIDFVLPALYLLRELSRTSPSWLSDREPVLSAIVNIWRSILLKSRDPKTDMSGPHYQIMPTLILEMLITALRHQHHVALLFHVVEAFEIRSSFEKSFVSFFLYQQAALQESVEYRREVIEHFLSLYEDPLVTMAFKTNALRLIINPTVRIYFADEKNDGSLISQATVQKVSTLMWQPLGVTAAAARALDDTTLIEIFVLTTLLVHHCSPKVADARKHVFKLAWVGINLLEPTVKLTAYVLAARFMSTFDTPFKFVRLTWIGVLRLKDAENRTLFRQAADILAACLPIRDPPTTGTPEWAQRLRAILVEDGPATGQVVSVCELLVNHADLFYDYRELYVPQIANSLSKLAFTSTSTVELRKLTIDIIELIFKWEKKRMALRDEAMDVDEKRTSPASKRPRADRAATVVSASSGGGWAAPSQVREMMTSHLLRFVATAQEASTRSPLIKRALDLFKQMLGPGGLPNMQVKLNFLHRTLGHDITQENINQVANSTEVIAAVAAVKDRHWIRANLGLLTKLLEKVWMFDDSSLHEVIQDLTEQMLKEMPEDENAEGDQDAKALLAVVQNAVTEGLAASVRSSAQVPGTIFLLHCWLKAQPKQLQNETISSGLLKVLANLIKVQTSNQAPESAHRLIMSILDLLRDRVADLREQRKHLQGVLITLIERSNNIVLCRYLLDLVRHWILDDADLTSQGKEKAALLSRMSVFEQRDQSLYQSFLDVVYDIYETEGLRGTDITHRLEPAFLLGTRSKDPSQRAKFLDKLEANLPVSLDMRLQALFSLQNWDVLADTYFIPEILTLLLGVARHDDALVRHPVEISMEGDSVAQLIRVATTGDLIQVTRTLSHLTPALADHIWTTVFPLAWAALSRQQQTAFTPHLVKLLSRDNMRKQVDMRPNVIQTLLRGILACSPPIALPPTLIKFLAKTFDAWYVGFELLSNLSEMYKGDDALRETCATSLSELYAELCEDDMYYGLARSRCTFGETTAALTYEQNGRWQQALELYETAQTKARNNMLPFSEDEYCLWEDHWILAAQKLQNWDWLLDLGRVDNDADLLLECAWRLSDWTSPEREMSDQNIAKVIDIPTPRRKTFEAYSALLKAHFTREPPNDFLRILDEAQQVSLRKWVSLPSRITQAHLPLLQMFQQCVELVEAAQVFDSLSMTNAANLEMRVNGDLKQIFHTWRDRLPNFYDDINVWSDMLAWRNHVFQAVTKVYVPLIPQGETGTYGYRGYHETAWMINRFGEVARRHGLLDVCSVALNKIYSLPNIEISEAFLKLREQALCFFQKPDKFNDGLENISTTNLMYFAPAQKSEFLTLKGMFISRLGQDEEANAEFAHAIQMDMSLPMAWAEWGRFNDKLYRDRPESAPPVPDPEPGKPKMTEDQYASVYARDRAVLASSAVSCYLQAAGLYNNHKSRALLLRVLWLLGLDDSHATVSRAFENYKGDMVICYWLTLIPQLLMSLSHREAKHARLILMRIAKQHPQALFYNLRVTREDFSSHKRQVHNIRQLSAARKAVEAKGTAGPGPASGSTDGQTPAEAAPNGDNKENKEEAVAAVAVAAPGPAPAVPTAPNGNNAPNATLQVPAQPMPAPRQPLDLVEEIMNMLKTTHPLLALTMEKMVDQISLRAKPSSEEDIYRFFAALLNDAMQQWGGRNSLPNDEGELNQGTRDNLSKFAGNLTGDLRAAIETDFMKDMPKLREYIKRLQFWRDTYEKSLDARPRTQPIDQGGCNLLDFHHTRFEEVEVPGQYVQHIDQTDDMVKIARFSSKAELGRGHGHCFRRILMIGSNGETYTWNVQLPAARHCRREERLTQLFRIMNSVLKKRVEARRRNLQFHLPTAVALAPQLRLVQNDSSYVSLQDIYDDFCDKQGMSRENSIMAVFDRMKQLHDPTMTRQDARFLQLKIEVMDEIQSKMVPETILTNYMIRTMISPDDLWLMRKQFALQTATIMFLTYVCSLSNRTPSRFHLSRRTGLMYMTEILPAFANGRAMIESNESVPFRLTPNMQHFITRTGIEGLVTSAVTAIARSLTMPEFDLSGSLSLFIRDEILTWASTYNKDAKTEAPITQTVYKNVDAFIRRASLMGYLGENKDKAALASPAVHLIVQLISQATAPLQLAQMGENFMAWY